MFPNPMAANPATKPRSHDGSKRDESQSFDLSRLHGGKSEGAECGGAENLPHS
jgi:hypothetical protein